MRHTAVLGRMEGVCNGEVVEERESLAQDQLIQRRGLPILGQPQPASSRAVWRCQTCDKRWTQEPLPDEAL